MWPSHHPEIAGDSLTTVMVLAQKLKLHNPVLTAAPGLHEEMCLQITRRNNRTFNNSIEDIVDCHRHDEKGNQSTSASSTLSSVCDANDEKTGKSPFLQKKPPIPKTLECASQKLNACSSNELKQYKTNRTTAGFCNQKHHSAVVSSSAQRSRTPSRSSGRQRRPLLSQTAVDIDTENDTDAETSEMISMSDEEIKSFAIGTMSNSDYDDAFESVSDSSAKEDNGKGFGRLNFKSRLTNPCDQKQEIIRTRMSPSLATKPCKENVRGAKVKTKATIMSLTTPAKLSSPSMPFRDPHSGNQDLGTKFCRFSPLRQRTGKNDTDGAKQSPKTYARTFEKIQASDRQDDGLGASLDDNEDDEDVQPGDDVCRLDSLNAPVMRKKRNDVKKGRNIPGRRQDDANGSDTSNTSSSSSLCYSPYTTFSPADTSSPLSQSVINIKQGRNSDLKEKLIIGNNNGSCPVNGTTDFGQKLNLLQSELVQLRHHDENLARQFLQIYKDIQILKVQRACLDHQDLLDDAIDEVEDRDRLLDLCDTPPLKHSGSKLRHCGLTKMNICSRRFSCS